MRRPRFRLRSLMIAVAAAAVLLGAGAIWWRHREYRLLSRLHHGMYIRTEENYYTRRKQFALEFMLAKEGKLDPPGGNSPGEVLDRFDREIVFMKKLMEYHKSLNSKYRQAATRPWLSVGPDPPPPE